ncbi:MAG: D-glucuronyl C5-epimerase family protein [Eubacteriales bacterium]|nr:D-glucuronyl C5-epimerase family protein [Eubacteriales bacterium]
MKRIIIKALHKIVNAVATFRVCFERFYIRIVYRHVVNDLNIRNVKPYDPLGIYVTLRRRPPSNYNKIIASFNLDSKGIRRYFAVGENGSKELDYNGILIAQQGLTEYGYYLYDNKQHRLNTMKQVAEWFIENQDVNSGAWHFHFRYYNANVSSWLEKPWISAMCQGQAISFLCRFAKLSGDNKYLKVVDRALGVFEKTVTDGGVVSFYDSMPVYEEYPTDPPSYTLNGFIYSLFGLYDAYKLADNRRAETLFNNGIKTLEHILPLYDDSHHTYYDLGHITAPLRSPRQNSKYHVLHIILLKSLYSITGNSTVEFYANKWAKQ